MDGASPLELRDAYLPEDLSIDLKLIWRNCAAHFNGEDSWLASYSRKVGKQAQDILDRFSRTHAHLHNLREELQKDDWDLDEETRNFHKVLTQRLNCLWRLHDRESVHAVSCARWRRRDATPPRRRRRDRVDGVGATPRLRDAIDATASKRHTHAHGVARGSPSPRTQAAETDPSCMGYVHWTFPDQTVEDQYPSYLMARRVRPLRRWCPANDRGRRCQ